MCVAGWGRSLMRRRSFSAVAALLALFSIGAPIFVGTAVAEPVETADDGNAVVPGAAKAMEAPPRGLGRVGPSPVVTRGDIFASLDREARRAGLPPEIAEAVAHTESGFNPRVVGADGEIGLMQVLPSTARMMGFSGTLAELATPETNIRYGVTYLAQAWRLAGGDLCTAVMKYRAGHGESRFSHLSVDYCLKVRARLTWRGFQVAGVVPMATFGRPAGSSGCRGRCLSAAARGPDFAALNSKLSQIAFRVTIQKVPTR